MRILRLKKLRNPSQTVAGPGMDAGGSDPHSFLSPTGHHPAGCIQLPAGPGLLWVMSYVDGAPQLGNQVAL